jgi:hypothetical protein
VIIKMAQNYACTKCGRSFSRKSSAVRHINNVESGQATVVPYPAYVAGLQTHLYLPPLPRPTYATKRDPPKKTSLSDLFLEKCMEELARRAAEKACQSPQFVQFLQGMMVIRGTESEGKTTFDIDGAIADVSSAMQKDFEKVMRDMFGGKE